MKPLITISYDMVIGTPDGKVSDGFFEWANEARKYFRLSILGGSLLHKDYKLRQDWLYANLTAYKWDHPDFNLIQEDLPFATALSRPLFVIDHRVVRFDGDWKELDPKKLANFKSWYERSEVTTHE